MASLVLVFYSSYRESTNTMNTVNFKFMRTSILVQLLPYSQSLWWFLTMSSSLFFPGHLLTSNLPCKIIRHLLFSAFIKLRLYQVSRCCNFVSAFHKNFFILNISASVHGILAFLYSVTIRSPIFIGRFFCLK